MTPRELELAVDAAWQAWKARSAFHRTQGHYLLGKALGELYRYAVEVEYRA